MPHTVPRPIHLLGVALCLLAGVAMQARARTMDTTSEEHIRRLKDLQHHLLMAEPAGRAREVRERREHASSRRHRTRKVGLASRSRPAPGGGEQGGSRIPEAVRRFQVTGGAAAATVDNYPVSDPTGEPGGSCQSEVSIAANCSFLVAAWNDGEGCSICDPPTSSQGFAYSSDGGKTWTDGGSPPNTNIGIWASDPVVVVNPTTGAFYYAGLCDLPSGMNGIGVVKGTFNGSVFSWETPKLVRQVSTSSDVLDKEWLAVDPSSGTLFLSYTHFTASGDRIEFERSTDDNQTWTNLQTLSSSQESGFVQGSRPAVGPDGEVYVTWEAIGQGNRQSPTFNSLYGRDFMRIRKSTNGGLSFGPQLTADSLFSNFGSGAPGFNRATGVTFPGIAVDRSTGPHRGRVYLTWNESLDFYEDDLGLGTKQSEIEPDNTPAQATAFVLGQVLRGASAATSKTGVDLDYFSFLGTQGQTVVLWLDSLDVNLDAAFRLYCNDVHINDPDYPTRLSFSGTDGTPGLPAGSQGLLVYTLPADGTYYLRLASFHGATGGSYRVQTGLHDPRSAPMDDRARDHRDVFVKTSDNGITWNSTVRVNDDPGYFDDWLPEVAVSGDGRAHV
ncbi:MAG TPA: pre-peptidase C-terminal domain-containing protein, partial [Candidatus Eisenbacteria bacterium]